MIYLSIIWTGFINRFRPWTGSELGRSQIMILNRVWILVETRIQLSSARSLAGPGVPARRWLAEQIVVSPNWSKAFSVKIPRQDAMIWLRSGSIIEPRQKITPLVIPPRQANLPKLPKKIYVHFKGKYYGKIAKFHSKKTLVSRKRKFHLNFL